jgi:hypothetical protein
MAAMNTLPEPAELDESECNAQGLYALPGMESGVIPETAATREVKTASVQHAAWRLSDLLVPQRRLSDI